MKICLAAGLLTACASSGDRADEAQDPTGDAFYTLRTTPAVHHPRPLPAQTDVLVDWHDAQGGTRTVTGFRAWDFLGDGRFQMIEVLGPDGETTSYVYDFDGDGGIDQVIDVKK